MKKNQSSHLTLTEAAEALRARVQGLHARGGNATTWIRAEESTGDGSILGLLRRLPGHQAGFYWCDRDHHGEWAGWGVAKEWVFSGDVPGFLKDILHDLQQAPDGVRLGGGWAMDPSAARDESWRDLGSGVFWAPLLEWGRRGTEGYLAVNLPAGPLPEGQFAELDLILSRLGGLQQRLPEVPQGKVAGHQPSEEEWLARVEEVLGEISRGTYRKIVLARKTAVAMDPGADPASYLATRMHSGLDVFLLRRGGSVFWGLSPERLISRNRDQVWSEALAGTRPRGATIADDQKLERELLGSDKDRREQDLVREFIEGTMGPWCRKVQTGITQVRKFRSIQHLYTPFQGDLRNADAFAELAGALHPTPAVAIFQQGRRLDIIRDLEGFDRGWYGGVAGWLSKDQGELAVGIRSCLSRGASWTFWTGAGIVEGSSGHREWHELEQKLSAYGDLLS